MKAYSGFESKPSGRKMGPLPAGGYVAVVKAVKLEGKEPDQSLIIRMDVAEGDYKDYFMQRYMAEKKKGTYEPRYKGDFRLRVYNVDNKKAQYPESDKARFEDAIWRFEQSNPGFHWAWDEQQLVGLTIGINMQAGEYNGNPYTRIGRLEVAQDVRNGKVTTMKPREPRSDAYEPPVDQQTGFVQVEDDDVPF